MYDLEHLVSRRSFLANAATLAAATAWADRAEGAVQSQPKFSAYPFQLGVASGDPSADGMVLWTRLAPKPLEGGGMPAEPVAISWQVADDEGMTQVVREGKTVANVAWGHSVHVEVEGLRPDRWYWYRFKAGSEVSPVGRTRTMPSPDAQPESLKFAVASCQHFETGYFTAYDHMAREELDLVVHLGDYIYEGPTNERGVRQHVGPKLTTLDHYRNRYAQYKTDPHLQRMHARAPWIVTWDDHEFENNYAAGISERANANPLEFLQHRARAYQAYYENMPLRRRSLPKGPDLRLYRRLEWGRLAQFYVLDTRQYRTDQPNGDGLKAPGTAAFDPKGSLLGPEQRSWLTRGLGKSDALWNILAQQVMMARVDRMPGTDERYSMDQWPGYEHERRELLRYLGERRIANPVVLTGDVHTNWANELHMESAKGRGPVVAAELVGTSITSGGDGRQFPANLDAVVRENPFVKYYNAERGYVRCQLTPRSWWADYRCVPYVTRTGAPVITRASFVLEPGSSQLHRG